MQRYKSLFICDFNSFLQIHPTFYPTKILMYMAFNGHGNFISWVTDGLCQSDLDI